MKARDCLRRRRPRRRKRLVDLSEGYSSEAVLAALVEVFEVVPEHLRGSVTFDQGSEWAEWQTMAATHDLSVCVSFER